MFEEVDLPAVTAGHSARRGLLSSRPLSAALKTEK